MAFFLRTAFATSLIGVSLIAGCGDASGNSQNYYRAGQGADNTGNTDQNSTGGQPASTPTSGGTGGGVTQGQALTVEVSASAIKAELYENKQFTLTVKGVGANGKVALALAGVDAAALDASLDKPTLDITPTAAQTAMVTVKSRKGGDVSFEVTLTAGTEVIKKTFVINTEKTLTIPISNGAQANKGDPALFGGTNSQYEVSNAVPLKLRFKNLDATKHIIHGGDPGQGFVHGSQQAGQEIQKEGGFDADRMITAAKPAGYEFYLHDNQGTSGKLKILN
jgi:hypothetical protein